MSTNVTTNRYRSGDRALPDLRELCSMGWGSKPTPSVSDHTYSTHRALVESSDTERDGLEWANVNGSTYYIPCNEWYCAVKCQWGSDCSGCWRIVVSSWWTRRKIECRRRGVLSRSVRHGVQHLVSSIQGLTEVTTGDDEGRTSMVYGVVGPPLRSGGVCEGSHRTIYQRTSYL